MKTLEKIAVFTVALVAAFACGSPELPEAQIDTLRTVPAEYASEVSYLAAVCEEYGRGRRQITSAAGVLRENESLSRGVMNSWMAARQVEEEITGDLIGALLLPREIRSWAEPCFVRPNPAEEDGYYLRFNDALGVEKEIIDLLRGAGKTPEDFGVNRATIRSLVLSDARFQVAELWHRVKLGGVSPMALDWLLYRACRRGFKSAELGLEPEYFICSD